MSSIVLGPCELDGWELERNTPCWDVPPDTPEDVIEKFRRMAADFLYAATGYRFGGSCTVAVRPCKKACADSWAGSLSFWPAGYNGSPWIPYVGRDGLMYNASVCGCPGPSCHCGPELCQIELAGPIWDIVKIDIDGVEVDPLTYSSLDARYLVRSSNAATVQPALAGCWPTCQDLSLPPGQPNTFTVYYRTGVTLPFAGQMALSELTAHYIRGCNGCGCGVGTRQNLSRMSRQGVDLEFISAKEMATDGLTGLEWTDRFITSYNPGKLPRAMRVLSPDSPRLPRVWMGY